VPFYGGHCHLPSSPSWGAAYPSLANWVYEYYDDVALVHKHYPGVKAYTDSLTARAAVADKTNHTLLDTGGWGDWCAPTGNSSKGGCGGHGTCGGSWEYISALRIMVAWATVTGNAADAAHYAAEEAKVNAAFELAYYHEGGFSCSATTGQTANALGLMVAPGATGALASLIGEVEQKGGHLDTGIVGTKYLFESLARGGRADIALAVLLQPTYPGYGYWLSQGATSLWENWEGSRYTHEGSWNHVMFGSASEFIFRHVAGIQQAPATRGFRAIEFHPSVLLAAAAADADGTSAAAVDVCAELGGVNASMVRPHGEIKAAWACRQSSEIAGSGMAALARGITYSIALPVGVPSRVHLPLVGGPGRPTRVAESGAEIFDGSKFIAGAARGVAAAALGEDGLSVVIETGSGSYTFVTSPK
jgi:alpha-L-rhamnosidase